MQVERLPRAGYQRMRWQNDGGWTSEIARASSSSPDHAFDWRISIAEIERDGPFSAFTGCDRTILVLQGEGMELRLDGDPVPALLNTRGRPFVFSGDIGAQCRLLNGATRDFNVMTRRAAYTQQVWFRPMVGPMVLLPERGVTWVVHVAAGHAHRQHASDGESAETGDTLVVRADDGVGPPVVLSGAGELVLVKLTALGTDGVTTGT